MIEDKYKTFWPRFFAGFIDGLLSLPVMGVSLLLWKYSQDVLPIIRFGWYVLSCVTFVAYSVLMHGLYGQTLGKMACQVKAIDLQGTKLTMRQAVLRDCVPIIIATAAIITNTPHMLFQTTPSRPYQVIDAIKNWTDHIWFWAELLTMLTNSKRRAIHDFIAGSVVVRTYERGIFAKGDCV